jgi:hypothetical protein
MVLMRGCGRWWRRHGGRGCSARWAASCSQRNTVERASCLQMHSVLQAGLRAAAARCSVSRLPSSAGCRRKPRLSAFDRALAGQHRKESASGHRRGVGPVLEVLAGQE